MIAALETAIQRGDSAAVQDLLADGVNADSRDRYGQTGLMLAAHAGHVEITRTLIAHGASLDITAKYGLSALMLAVVGGHAEVARLLLRAGADPSLRGVGAPGFADKTACDLAMARGMDDLARELKPR